MYFIELGINRVVGIAELSYSGFAASPHNICVFHNRMRLTPLSRSRNAKSQFGRHHSSGCAKSSKQRHSVNSQKARPTTLVSGLDLH